MLFAAAEAVLDGEVADTGRHTSSRKGARSELVEVVTRGERRRSWSAEQKRMIVVEAGPLPARTNPPEL